MYIFIYLQTDPKDADWKPPRWMKPREEERQVTWRCELCGQVGAGNTTRDQHTCPMDKSKVLYSPCHRNVKQEK